MTTRDDLIDEMLEFGLSLELAEHIAPALLPLLNDRRGFRRTLLEEAPLIAERCGLTQATVEQPSRRDPGSGTPSG